MTKLKELSAQALADLLNMPLNKARRWLEVAASVSQGEEPLFVRWFGDPESATSLRRSSVRELMDLSVEQVERLKGTGEFYRRFPYFKRNMPTDPEARLRCLRDLLGAEVEFEARYPAAFELLFPRAEAIRGLPLPSFDVRILKNAPATSVVPAGWNLDWRIAEDSGEAFSGTFGRRTSRDKEVDQSFAPLDLGYMRGILLAVLSREEYAERVATGLRNEAVREEVGAPPPSSVRITDLRLATAPEFGNLRSFNTAIRPLLGSLEKPLTANGVLQWKWDLLWEDEESRGRRSEETETKIARVSFAAAALLLFLDFRMPGIEEGSSFGLAGHITELADIVRKLSKSLNANATKLERLLAFRSASRPAKLDQEIYEALVGYRMGEDLEDVAKGLGITPYKSSPSRSGGDDWGGTRDWKSRLAERLARGAEVENRKYHLAVAVFRNRNKPRVDAKAKLAYRAYQRECSLSSEEEPPWLKIGDWVRIDASTDSGFEVLYAYVQLGSCLQRDLDPFPTHSGFNGSPP